jgi:phospholipid transport system substrate-binding protein
MTRIAVGPQWTTLSDSQRQQLVQEFSRMTIASYAANFARYAGETFEVDPSAVPRQSNRVLKSRLLIPQHDAVIFNYLFHSTPDGWKAIDIYLSGTISELATRRSEFSSILSAEGPEALISHLKSRADKLMQTG